MTTTASIRRATVARVPLYRRALASPPRALVMVAGAPVMADPAPRPVRHGEPTGHPGCRR